MQCTIVGDDVQHTVTALLNELSPPGLNATLCSPDVTSARDRFSCSKELYSFVGEVLLRLNVTSECCLGNGTHCGDRYRDDQGASIAESKLQLIKEFKNLYIIMHVQSF